MTNFVLIPGADGRAWYWHRLAAELERRGHAPTAVELPLDGSNGLSDYADAIVEAAGGARDLVMVAQSLGAFTGPLACDRLPVRMLVLLNPMVPGPGETAGDWWANTGHEAAAAQAAREDGRSADFDPRRDFFHDVPDELTEEAFAGDVPMADLDTVFAEPWPLDAWPQVRTHVLQGHDDRLFPPTFQGRVVRERLGDVPIDELPGGHLLALSQPQELAERLVALG